MSKPKRVVATSTHYWCEFCLKFIKNTAIDRKNHELGIPHQEAKSKKIEELRTGSSASKLDAQIAALEAAALKSISADSINASTSYSEFSTYQPEPIIYSAKPTMAVPPTKSENKPKQQTDPSAVSTTPEAETNEDPSSKEAALPGQWEEVEEESYDNPYFKAEIASEFADAAEARKPNPKKRERYEDDGNALDQMEAESKNFSSSATAERVPERYRTDLASVEPTEEPMFKKKVAKGANIKKRAKQL